MALMNSTVSHEMRNPLNSIINHNEKQAVTIQQLTQVLEGIQLLPEKQQAMSEILACLYRSLRISNSSTNLIRFNVEDILALPQLKAGKFSKNISADRVEPAIKEIIEIMAHQAEAKEVEVKHLLRGFPPQQVPFDKQRFQ